jgi:oligogalacturonide lyase
MPTNLICLRKVLAALVLSTAFAAAQTDSQSPPKSWIDPDTGHRVLRLTDEPNSASLYFNDNAYTSSGREMIYTTPDGISVLDLQTFKSKPVVHGRVRVIVAGTKTQNVYYLKLPERGPNQPTSSGSTATRPPAAPLDLYATNVDTGETRKVATLPQHAQIGLATVNADETLAAGTYIEGEGYQYGSNAASQTHPLDQPANKGQMMEQRLAARLPLVLFTINLKTGEMKTLLHSTDWVNHLLFSPTDPSLLMYCHEGPWHKVDRIWTIHTDGSQNMLIHHRTMTMEIAGHEFWSPDGKTIWYDLQTPKGQDFWLASYRLADGERTWYHLARNEWSIHFNVTRDGSLFCGDGGDPGQVAHAPDGEWIYLFHPELIKSDGINNKDLIQPGVFHAEKLVNMSKHQYKLEPNVRFSPDQKWVIFRSNMFGPTYTFGVEVAKANTGAATDTGSLK